MYKTFTEWKNGNWLEDGEPRKEAYTKDELLLVEMGWKYGFDAGKAQQADRIVALEKSHIELEKGIVADLNQRQSAEPVAYVNSMCNDCIDWKVEPINIDGKPLYTTPQIKELSDEEIYELWCESDNTELLPEMRNKDGSINYIILTFAELLLKKASEK